jgi:RNase P/RNase MRP subunit p29
LLRRRAWIAHASRVKGTVVSLTRQRKEGETLVVRDQGRKKTVPKYHYRPVVEFWTVSGKKIQFTARLATQPQPFQVGEVVEVLYDPDDPKRALINQPIFLWFDACLLIGCGIFGILMGLFGIMHFPFML